MFKGPNGYVRSHEDQKLLDDERARLRPEIEWENQRSKERDERVSKLFERMEALKEEISKVKRELLEEGVDELDIENGY